MSAIVSYATGALPHVRLRTLHRRSSLPSLFYRIAGNSVAAVSCETPAANDCYGRGGVERCRLLALLSVTLIRERSKLGVELESFAISPLNQKALLKVSADVRYFRMLNV